MNEVVEFLGTMGNVFLGFLNLIVDLFKSLYSVISSAIGFIIAIVTELPNIISNSMFSNLPFVFQYGIGAIFGVLILVFVMKLFALFKFW